MGDAPEPDDDKPDAEADGGVRAYTVRLELVDEPGELLRARSRRSPTTAAIC